MVLITREVSRSPERVRALLAQVIEVKLGLGLVTFAALVLLSPLNPGGASGLALMATFAASACVLALVALGALGPQDFEPVLEVLPAAFRPARGPERRRWPGSGPGGDPVRAGQQAKVVPRNGRSPPGGQSGPDQQKKRTRSPVPSMSPARA
jgi:hypothetical protein